MLRRLPKCVSPAQPRAYSLTPPCHAACVLTRLCTSCPTQELAAEGKPVRLDTRTDAAERALLATLQAVPVDVAPSPFQYLLGCATARASRMRTRLGACLRALLTRSMMPLPSLQVLSPRHGRGAPCECSRRRRGSRTHDGVDGGERPRACASALPGCLVPLALSPLLLTPRRAPRRW